MSKSWNIQDKQSFADRDILKARTIAPKRNNGPDVSEWDWRYDAELEGAQG